MNRNTKIILFIIIGVIIIALGTYGYIASQKLEEQKIEKVDSNIDDFKYDASADTLDKEEPEEEDLDGDEATDEDSDFEVYEEDSGWEDTESEMPLQKKMSKPKSKNEDGLEELYNPNKEEKKENKKLPIAKPALPESKANPPSDEPQEDLLSKTQFLVIVGSFKSKRNARKKLKQLESAGFDGLITTLRDSDLQSVVAGRFKTEAAAESFARELRNEHDLKAIVREE